MNEKVDIEIFRRRITVEMEGLTPMEISSLARTVDEKMREVSEHNPKIADTSKLATLTALSFAAELAKAKEARDTEQLILERKVDELNLAIQTALAAAGPKAR